MKSTLKSMSFILLVMLSGLIGLSCSHSPTDTLPPGQAIALEFVKNEATFQFDGMPETLKLVNSNQVGDDWKFTFEFDSRHAGYGNRSGQALAEVITHHSAEITVRSGAVISALMDEQWDMIKQSRDVEIKPAPIDEVKVSILKSNPPQISVYIKGGLADGCTAFHDIQTTRDGNTVNIKVTVQRPRGAVCPAIYTSFEKNVNLGIDFAFGTTYTLNVNDYTTTFEGTLMKNP